MSSYKDDMEKLNLNTFYLVTEITRSCGKDTEYILEDQKGNRYYVRGYESRFEEEENKRSKMTKELLEEFMSKLTIKD
jgi:hypothetical protein